MTDLDQLVETLQGHLGINGDALSTVLLSLDSDHLAILTQHLNGDELIRMLEGTGVEVETASPDDLRMSLEALPKPSVKSWRKSQMPSLPSRERSDDG